MSYTQQIFENGELIRHDTDLRDPFVNTTINLSGWRTAWRVLRGKYQLRYHIDADRETISLVMLLDPDYLGPENREVWNGKINDALAVFAGTEDTARGPVDGLTP
jgi:hypothetical protein